MQCLHTFRTEYHSRFLSGAPRDTIRIRSRATLCLQAGYLHNTAAASLFLFRASITISCSTAPRHKVYPPAGTTHPSIIFHVACPTIRSGATKLMYYFVLPHRPFGACFGSFTSSRYRSVRFCYKNNAIRLIDYSFGLKFAGGGIFVSLHHPGLLEARRLG